MSEQYGLNHFFILEYFLIIQYEQYVTYICQSTSKNGNDRKWNVMNKMNKMMLNDVDKEKSWYIFFQERESNSTEIILLLLQQLFRQHVFRM